MNRGARVHGWLTRNEGCLICPVCNQPLLSRDGGSIACPQGHSFDVGSKGTLHLTNNHNHNQYDRTMLQSRRAAAQSGFFDALLEQLTELVARHCPGGTLRLIDAGCGEGSQLHRLLGMLEERGKRPEAVGIDLSKEGIRLAGAYPGPLWCVADLTRLPFADRSFDCILNILSPANNGEFRRVLKPGGVVLKAVPGPLYLTELRQALYQDSGRQTYENDAVLAHFGQAFPIVETRMVQGRFALTPELWAPLLEMTPLVWGADAAQVERLRAEPLSAITTQWQVLAGRPID